MLLASLFTQVKGIPNRVKVSKEYKKANGVIIIFIVKLHPENLGKGL